MNRRAFLQLFIGSVAVATLPIPNFLLPKEEKSSDIGPYGSAETINVAGGTLTMEMIEEAAMKAANNFGQPDVLYMSKQNYKKLGRYFGYKVIYRGDDIFHVKL